MLGKGPVCVCACVYLYIFVLLPTCVGVFACVLAVVCMCLLLSPETEMGTAEYSSSLFGWGQEIRRLCSGSQRGNERVGVCARVCVCVNSAVEVGGEQWVRPRCVDISGLMV